MSHWICFQCEEGWLIPEGTKCPFCNSTHAQSILVAEQLPRASFKKYMYQGKEYTLRQLSRLSPVSSGALWWRIRKGWSLSKAINTPSQR